MNDSSLARNWAQSVAQRLSSDGFSISRDVEYSGGKFYAVAHRCRFELSKFGMCETFFVFGNLGTCNRDAVRRFSSTAFRYAKLARSIALPCGFFEAVFCFSVCMVDDLDEATAAAVRNDAPPKHWAAGEIPVVYERRHNRLSYFERTPLWGAAYYSGFRKQIMKYLAVT